MRAIFIVSTKRVLQGLAVALMLGSPTWLRAAPVEKTHFSVGPLRVTINSKLNRGGVREYWTDEVAMKLPDGWQTVLHGIEGKEFSTSLGDANATGFLVRKNDATGVVLAMYCRQDSWEAVEKIEMKTASGVVNRIQVYDFLKACQCAIHPGFQVTADRDVRYTYPMWAHEQPLTAVKPLGTPIDFARGEAFWAIRPSEVLRRSVDWAVPLPMHIWHDRRYVGRVRRGQKHFGGNDRFRPGQVGWHWLSQWHAATLRVYYPDSSPPVIPADGEVRGRRQG